MVQISRELFLSFLATQPKALQVYLQKVRTVIEQAGALAAQRMHLLLCCRTLTQSSCRACPCVRLLIIVVPVDKRLPSVRLTRDLVSIAA